jgi:hypothetical protein
MGTLYTYINRFTCILLQPACRNERETTEIKRIVDIPRKIHFGKPQETRRNTFSSAYPFVYKAFFC